MRIFAAFLLPAVIAAGNAHASSIVVLEAMQESIGPSIIMIGAPAGVTVDVPGGPSITTVAAADAQAFPSVTFLPELQAAASPSIIALGEPAISDEEVAAIPRSSNSMGPMVIRGGLVGEASVRPGLSGASQASAPAQFPALDPNDKGTPAKRKALKRRQQLLEQQEASAPAAAPEPAEPPEE